MATERRDEEFEALDEAGRKRRVVVSDAREGGRDGDISRYLGERMERQIAGFGGRATKPLDDEELRVFWQGYALAVEDLWSELDAVFRRFSNFPEPIRLPAVEVKKDA